MHYLESPRFIKINQRLVDLSRKAPKLRLPNIFVLEEIKTTASHYLQNLKIMRCLIYSQKKEKKNSKLYKFSLSSTPKCWDLHIWCAKFIPDEVSAFRPAFLTSVAQHPPGNLEDPPEFFEMFNFPKMLISRFVASCPLSNLFFSFRGVERWVKYVIKVSWRYHVNTERKTVQLLKYINVYFV